MAGQPIKAAQYVRMSTDKQVYSTVNQMAAIGSYAVAHGFDVVRTYADEGRSGLKIKGRAALQEMLRDVLSGDPGYRAILVFDVSRWGRFQDTDEAAHYEFLCRSSGVQVHYCAEGFDNDGSLASAIVKNLRRAMAGEYSRDLSAKVWAAQCRLVSMGYKMGGVAGYGLARMLVDQAGRPKQILARGEHKNLASDRVVLVPGDENEISTVKRMFRLAAAGRSNRAIAATLNADGVPAPMREAWDQNTIRQILKAERYVGNCTYNKRSAKLGAGYIHNTEGEWVRRTGAFPPIVSIALFSKVQRMKRSRATRYSKEALLDHLKALLAHHGHLGKELIESADGPAAKTYANHFGGLEQAFALIGYTPIRRRPTERKSYPVKTRDAKYAVEAAELLRNLGHRVEPGRAADLLYVDNCYTVAARLCPLGQQKERRCWRIAYPSSAGADLVLAALMEGDVQEYLYIIPVSRFGKGGRMQIEGGSERTANYEVWNLDLLPEMIRWHAGQTANAP